VASEEPGARAVPSASGVAMTREVREETSPPVAVLATVELSALAERLPPGGWAESDRVALTRAVSRRSTRARMESGTAPKPALTAAGTARHAEPARCASSEPIAQASCVRMACAVAGRRARGA
jgi:hypothetical protein